MPGDLEIASAAKLLPIAEIALSVGFGSVHSFYRAFSEEYGLSPQEYRRREGRMA